MQVGHDVDAGEVRVGLAICDPDERVAVPMEIVPASAAARAMPASPSGCAMRWIATGAKND